MTERITPPSYEAEPSHTCLTRKQLRENLLMAALEYGPEVTKLIEEIIEPVPKPIPASAVWTVYIGAKVYSPEHFDGMPTKREAVRWKRDTQLRNARDQEND